MGSTLNSKIDAASPVFSFIIATLIITATVSAALFWGKPFMDDMRSETAQENVGSQLNAVLEAIDDLTDAGDSTSLPISADSGYIESEASKSHIVNKPESSGQEDILDEGDRTILWYSLDDNYNFTVSDLDDGDNFFNVTMEQGSVTKAEAYWLDNGTMPRLRFNPPNHDFAPFCKGRSKTTTFEIWNDGIDKLTYQLSDNGFDGLEVSPIEGSSTGEHDTITVTVDTTDIPFGSYDYSEYYITITSNGDSTNGLKSIGTGTFGISFQVLDCDNQQPTAAHNNVTTNEDTVFTFVHTTPPPPGENFYYDDNDENDLDYVLITDLDKNASDCLKLDGAKIKPNQQIPRDDIMAGLLTFTPRPNENGIPYAMFKFRVSDGIDESILVYNMTINVTAVNDVPIVRDIPNATDLYVYPGGKVVGDIEGAGGGEEKNSFEPIPLDNFLIDPDLYHEGDTVTWFYSGNNVLIVDISGTYPKRVAVVSLPEPGGLSLDQANEDQSGSGFQNNMYYAQKFKVGASGQLEKVELSISAPCPGEITLEDITIQIRNELPDLSKFPPPPLAEAVIPTFCDPTFNWKTATFNDPYNASDGEELFIVVLAAVTAKEYYWEVSPGDSYPDGCLWFNPGAGWDEECGTDFIFRTYINESGWSGTENILFTATDSYSASDSDDANFTVIAPPVVDDIPDQLINTTDSRYPYFYEISLDDYVADYDNTDAEISWSTSSSDYLLITIDANRVANISVKNPPWSGMETITFFAEDPDLNMDSDDVTFTSWDPGCPPPDVLDIPGETVDRGDPFSQINLDDYVNYAPPKNELVWEASGNEHLSVDIDGNRVATISSPSDWSGSETITFKATRPCGSSDEDSATFTVRSYEVVTGPAHWFDNDDAGFNYCVKMFGYLAGAGFPANDVETWFEWRANAGDEITTSGISQRRIIDTSDEPFLFQCNVELEKQSWLIKPDVKYRAFADYGGGTVVKGEWKTCKITSWNVIDTEDTTDIGTTSAKLWGKFHALSGIVPKGNDGENYVEGFFILTGNGEVRVTYPPTRIHYSDSTVWKTFSYTIDGLRPFTSYTVKAVISVGSGEYADEDNVKEFTTEGPPFTLDLPPEVFNLMVYNIGSNQAKLQLEYHRYNYFVYPQLGQVRFQYRKPGQGITNTPWVGKNAPCEYSYTIGSLTADQEYEWRAQAQTPNGIGSATHWAKFKTLPSGSNWHHKPEVITDGYFKQSLTKVYLYGNLLDQGQEDSCDLRGISCWNGITGPGEFWVNWTRGGSPLVSDYGDSRFSIGMLKLWFVGHGNKWQYRAWAETNYVGDPRGYGEWRDFWIGDGDPVNPTASFYISGTNGRNITFESNSNENDEGHGTVGIEEYYWSFGDSIDSTYISISDDITHYYTTPGDYTVTLKVRDDEDQHDLMQMDVTVNCFLAGTKVLMADGTYKNIENVKIGDLVQSYDEQTGEFTICRVAEVFHHSPEDMTFGYYLVINDALRVTPNHLMYSNGKWIAAGNLKVGDSLFGREDNIDYRIYSIEKVYEKESTFDLGIERCHTYLVSIDDSVDVLVHNDNYDGIPAGTYHWETLIQTPNGVKEMFNSVVEPPDLKWPFTGTVCIYLYDTTVLFGKIWIFDSDSLVYTIASSEKDRKVIMEYDGVIFSESGSSYIKSADPVYEEDETIAIRIQQIIVSSSFSAGSIAGGSKFNLNANLYMNYVRDLKSEVFDLGIQFWEKGDNDDLWLEYFKNTYNFIELLGKTNTLYYEPSEEGVRLALSHYVVGFDV